MVSEKMVSKKKNEHKKRSENKTTEGLYVKKHTNTQTYTHTHIYIYMPTNTKHSSDGYLVESPNTEQMAPMSSNSEADTAPGKPESAPRHKKSQVIEIYEKKCNQKQKT